MFDPSMSALGLTDEQKNALREREQVNAKADVFFRACPVCAFMAWSRTNHEGTGQTVVTLDTGVCSKCEEMRFRHGELFDYMLFIMRGQRILAAMIDRAEARERAVRGDGGVPL